MLIEIHLEFVSDSTFRFTEKKSGKNNILALV